MKPFLNLVTLFTGVVLLLLVTGCATTKHEESMLTFAGFKIVVAKTPKQQQKLEALTPGKFTRILRNGKTWYVYPETARNRLYLGTKNEYQQYWQNVKDAKLSRQNFDSAVITQEESAEWNDWGDWEVIFINAN